MKKTLTALSVGLALAGFGVQEEARAATFDGLSKAFTYSHAGTQGFLSEIVTFDALTKTLWVAGVSGVDVLDAKSGSLISRIDTTAYGSINSVAVHNGIAAFAMEKNYVAGVSNRSDAGQVMLFNTQTRQLASGINQISVGSLPDMVTFTPDGSKLLVANEGTPNTRADAAYVLPDPVGSVSIISMASRSVTATATLAGVVQTGTHLRTNTGMDFEPEYITVNASGTKAFVSLQEANGMGVLNLQTGSFEKVVGLGVKDFSLPGNQIDVTRGTSPALVSANVKGYYMPDGMASFDKAGKTYVLMANEGDYREDNADRGTVSGGAANGLRYSRVDSTNAAPIIAGARSFSIRDEDGNMVYDSGDILDREAIALGIYNDDRSRDKGTEPEGVTVLSMGNKTFAFVGLERTAYNSDAGVASNHVAAIAIFDITDPANSSFVQMIKSDGDMAPEGLKAYALDGNYYLAFSNEVSNTTSVYQLAAAPVPEPTTYALMLAGLGLLMVAKRRRSKV